MYRKLPKKPKLQRQRKQLRNRENEWSALADDFRTFTFQSMALESFEELTDRNGWWEGDLLITHHQRRRPAQRSIVVSIPRNRAAPAHALASPDKCRSVAVLGA